MLSSNFTSFTFPIHGGIFIAGKKRLEGRHRSQSGQANYCPDPFLPDTPSGYQRKRMFNETTLVPFYGPSLI